MSDLTEQDITGGVSEPAEPSLGAWKLFRRGVEESPELRTGLISTIIMGLAVAVGRIVIPVVIQRTIDQAISTDASGSVLVDMGQVVTFALIAIAIVLGSTVVAIIARRRMIVNAEAAIYGLRTRAFGHVHKLSLADHVDSSSGTFLTRVTSDVQAISRFCEWGLLTWTVGPMVILGVFVVMALYSWQLALIVFIAFMPTVPFMKWVQGKQLVAYDKLRASVAFMVGRANEAIIGAGTVRAYGVGERAESRVREATDQRYTAGIRRNKFMAMVFSTGDFFGSLALAAAFAIGIWQRDNWGLSGGTLVAVLFLITLLNEPIGELGETTDRTQEAIAGWRKILELLDMPVDVIESDAGNELPREALSITATNVDFSYRHRTAGVAQRLAAHPRFHQRGRGRRKPVQARPHLRNSCAVSRIPPMVLLSWVAYGLIRCRRSRALRRFVWCPRMASCSTRRCERTSVWCRVGATDADIEAAVVTLELDGWVAGLPDGLDTEVGARGDYLSVGERQLVRPDQGCSGDPGLLVLDEATSSVDPETDRALTETIAPPVQRSHRGLDRSPVGDGRSRRPHRGLRPGRDCRSRFACRTCWAGGI